MVKFAPIALSFLLCLTGAAAWSEPSEVKMTYRENDPESFEPIVDEIIVELEEGTRKIEKAMEETDDDDERERLADALGTAVECHKRAKKIKAPLKGLKDDMEVSGELRRALMDSPSHEFVGMSTESAIEFLEEGTLELEAEESKILDELEDTKDEKKNGPRIKRLGKMQDTLVPAKETLECVRALDKKLKLAGR